MATENGVIHPKSIGLPAKLERHFLGSALDFSAWANLEPWFLKLNERTINSVADLEAWIRDWSELESVFGEESGWRYINRSCDTTNPQYQEAYNFYVKELDPKMAPYNNSFEKKLVESPYLAQLPQGKYDIWIRALKESIRIYRDENIPLFTDVDELAQDYAHCIGSLTITWEGTELTIPQAGNLLKNPDREIRRQVFDKIVAAREVHREKLDTLFSKMVALRHRIAQQAGFENYRDYTFSSLGRFDYTPADCYTFHQSVMAEVVPLGNAIDSEKQQQLGVESFRPYDTTVDVKNRMPLRPFETSDELLDKTIVCLGRVHASFADYFTIMRSMNRFDLESRKGKAPGGYNYSLHDSGVPFVFMNAANAHRDVVTIVHEAGHAVHAFLMRDLEVKFFRENPSEIDELASMAMELMTMEHWDVFYSDAEELRRARTEHLEKIMSTLSWVAAIDRFQHWIYENPEHTVAERTAAWMRIEHELGSNVIDWSGYEHARETLWHRQLHVFEMPFYYIEYGFAQLGAIAVWRNYKNNPEKAVADYMAALRLGYTKSIGGMYEAAGVHFNFSREYVRELMQFVKTEYDRYNKG